MAQSLTNMSALESSLEALGMVCFGGFTLEPNHCPEGREDFVGRSAILVGNAGSAMWDVFSRSEFAQDGHPNPMDRWTQDSVTSLSAEFGLDPLFPFEKPFWPFQRFAVAATGMKSSPLGLLIHPVYGLWQAYRAALVLDASQENAHLFNGLLPAGEAKIHPCDTCVDKPCLTACPVDAFTGATLEVEPCRAHLASDDVPRCMEIGCRARGACPVGEAYTYADAQVQFHMRSFKNA